MYHPTTRVLTVLELLQTHTAITGMEIARLLEVDIRTVRRYIVMLEEMGIPITADRGCHGGYRLIPGFKMPPLMFNEDEALALTVGLLAARRLGLAAYIPGTLGALAKVEQVLPPQVRQRVRAVEETVVWDLGERADKGPDANVVLTLCMATREQRRVSLQYYQEDGAATKRTFDSYGLVCRRDHWYTIGHCHLRDSQRLFRLDRIQQVIVQEDSFERPANFNVLAAVQTALGSVPRGLPVEVALDTTLQEARRHISAGVATLEESATGGILLRGYTDNPDWLARILARLGCRLEVRQPPELRDSLRCHATQIALWAEAVN